jgi:hypothetical protein
MHWKTKEKRKNDAVELAKKNNPWRKVFLLLPKEINGNWHWLEYVERKHNVRVLVHWEELRWEYRIIPNE